MEADPARFDCDACLVRQQAADLWPENAEAWELWSTLMQPVVTDLKLAPQVFAWATEGVSAGECLELVRRLAIIRDTLTPQEYGQPETDDRRRR